MFCNSITILTKGENIYNLHEVPSKALPLILILFINYFEVTIIKFTTDYYYSCSGKAGGSANSLPKKKEEDIEDSKSYPSVLDYLFLL